MAEALEAFEAGARVDGHTPDSGRRFRYRHTYLRDRFAHLLHRDGFEPARSFSPAPFTLRGSALAAHNTP